MAQDEAAPAVDRLDEEACWDVLRRLEFGRLAYQVGDRLDIAPINYAVHGEEIVFRTAEGSKLAGVLEGRSVVFEVDEVTAEQAVSVIVRAKPREFDHDEARWSDQMRLRPWVRTVKDHVVGLDPVEISGRRFTLHRTWAHMRPES